MSFASLPLRSRLRRRKAPRTYDRIASPGRAIRFRLLVDGLDDRSRCRLAGLESAFHVTEIRKAGVLAGKEQAVLEALGQQRPGEAHLAGGGTGVAGGGPFVARPGHELRLIGQMGDIALVDAADLLRVERVDLRLVTGPVVLESFRRDVGAGKQAELDRLLRRGDLVVRPFPGDTELVRDGGRGEALADPEALLERAEIFHSRPHR